jgi:hypothetical protein
MTRNIDKAEGFLGRYQAREGFDSSKRIIFGDGYVFPISNLLAL